MPLNFPDELRHNNVDAGLVDTDFVKGGTRTAISTLTNLYQLTAKKPLADTYIGQLKDYATRVWVRSEGKYYTLVNEASAHRAEGWVTDNVLLSGVINASIFNTQSVFVTAFDGDLNSGYIQKASNSAGIDKSVIFEDGTGKLGVNITNPSVTLHLSATDAIVIPVGNNAQRPVAAQGAIRYNTEGQAFEGYDGSNWGSLGGVKDVDQNTYISAEDSPGVNNNELKFFTDGSEKVRILSGGNVGVGTTAPNEKLTVVGNISATGNITTPSTVYAETGDFSGTVDANAFTIDSTSVIDSGRNASFNNIAASGNLTVTGNLSVLGDATTIETTVTTTSAFSITNEGTGPALTVTQHGSEAIAHFIDQNGDDIIFADNGYVGLGTLSPNHKLTVVGSVSATADVIGNGVTSYIKSFIIDGGSF